MTPIRWQEIERIYHSALERPPAERAAFLAEACKSDPDLRREVESLLAENSSKPGRGTVQVSTAGGTYPQWGPLSGGRSELFYVSGDSKLMAAELTLAEGSVDASPPRELFALAPAETRAGYSPYDTAPDGQHFVVRTPVDAVRPLTAIVNWPALLKKGTGTR